MLRSDYPGYQWNSHVRVLVWLAKTKYGDKAKLCYTDTVSFIVHVKSEDVYADLTGDLRSDLIHQTVKSIDPYL